MLGTVTVTNTLPIRYVGVGTGFGGENNATGLPGSGTGCLAWMQAGDSNLESFNFTGCLLTNNHTDGSVGVYVCVCPP